MGFRGRPSRGRPSGRPYLTAIHRTDAPLGRESIRIVAAAHIFSLELQRRHYMDMRSNRPYRVSHRLRGFDYSLPEAYYVTICTFQKRCIFGVVQSNQVNLSWLGDIVNEEWLKTAELRPYVRLSEFQIMPNHMHGILVLEKSILNQPRRPSLGTILGNFKGAVTKRVRQRLKKPSLEVWQPNYYDHIIRDDDDWERIRAYILENPMNWSSDPENPHM